MFVFFRVNILIHILFKALNFYLYCKRDKKNYVFNILVIVFVLVGGRLVASTVSDTNCSCAKTRANVWCWMMKMTDLWRDMMHEKIISEVKQIKLSVPLKR